MSSAAPGRRTLVWRLGPMAGLLGPALILLLLASLRPMGVPDEGRYGEVARWMLMSGDFLVPRLDGIAFLHKPPLAYWVQAAFMALVGVSAPAARLAAMLHALLMLMATQALVRAWWNDTIAQRTAWVLGTSLGWLLGGQYINHDMAVACWITLAIGCLAWSFEQGRGDRPHAGWALAGALAAGLGVMSKGLIGVLLPGLVLTIWLWHSGHWRMAHRLPWLRGLGLVLLVCLPWLLMVEHEHAGALAYLFGRHQWQRFAEGGFNNAQPLGFYLVVGPLLLGAWAPWLLMQGWRAARGHPTWQRLCATPQQSRLVALAWLWVAAILLFFSVPQSKLVGYALPVLPPMALLAALGWSCTTANTAHARGWWVTAVLLAVAVVVSAQWVGTVHTRRKSAADVAQALRCLAPSDAPLWLSGGYPYDLPFLRQSSAPMRVAGDWAAWRQAPVPDSWQRELMEGAALDPVAGAAVLREAAELQQAAVLPGQWLVLRRADRVADDTAAARALTRDAAMAMGWRPVFEGRAWVLYASGPHAESASPTATAAMACMAGIR